MYNIYIYICKLRYILQKDRERGQYFHQLQKQRHLNT